MVEVRHISMRVRGPSHGDGHVTARETRAQREGEGEKEELEIKK